MDDFILFGIEAVNKAQITPHIFYLVVLELKSYRSSIQSGRIFLEGRKRVNVMVAIKDFIPTFYVWMAV
jgi:hypothetical protein